MTDDSGLVVVVWVTIVFVVPPLLSVVVVDVVVKLVLDFFKSVVVLVSKLLDNVVGVKPGNVSVVSDACLVGIVKKLLEVPE